MSKQSLMKTGIKHALRTEVRRKSKAATGSVLLGSILALVINHFINKKL